MIRSDELSCETDDAIVDLAIEMWDDQTLSTWFGGVWKPHTLAALHVASEIEERGLRTTVQRSIWQPA